VGRRRQAYRAPVAGDEDGAFPCLWDAVLFGVDVSGRDAVSVAGEDGADRLPYREDGRDLFQRDRVVWAPVRDRRQRPTQRFQDEGGPFVLYFWNVGRVVFYGGDRR
jgi:hypothetical protein